MRAQIKRKSVIIIAALLQNSLLQMGENAIIKRLLCHIVTGIQGFLFLHLQ